MECTCAENSKVKALWGDAECHIVVTGASRGFGRSFCLRLVEALTNDKDLPFSINLLLMGRDLSALNKTEALIMASKNPRSTTELKVMIAQPLLDMADATESTLSEALKPFFPINPSGARKQWNLLVHNAGTLGCLKKRADERLSAEEQEKYYRVNLIAPMILTSLFVRHFAPFGNSHPPTMVINVSSLAAAQPFPHMSDYCTGKAARQMYLQSLAVDRPTIAVFNYSPGPLDTEMYTQLAEEHGDEKSKAEAAENKRTGRLIAPEESARVCVSWLRRFQVGAGPECKPEALVCPVHQSGWSNVWLGPRLDYYDAVAMEKK